LINFIFSTPCLAASVILTATVLVTH
jgi:hypothetical protein